MLLALPVLALQQAGAAGHLPRGMCRLNPVAVDKDSKDRCGQWQLRPASASHTGGGMSGEAGPGGEIRAGGGTPGFARRPHCMPVAQ